MTLKRRSPVTAAYAAAATALCLTFVGQWHAARAETRTAFEFSRAFDTCDDENDIALQSPGTAKVIYSWNDADPLVDGEPRYHGPDQRGARSVNLASPLPEADVPEEDAFILPIKFTEHTLPDNDDTVYYCKMFKLPDDKPYHVAKYEMDITEGNYQNVHHLSVWECPNIDSIAEQMGVDVDDIVSDLEDGIQGDCDDDSVFPQVLHQCGFNPYFFGYAVGGNPITLPKEAGKRTGAGGTRYLLANMHYDMPDLKGITDSSGVNLTMTAQLRENNLGFMWLGDANLNLAPGQERIDVVSTCPGFITRPLIEATPNKEINIIAVRAHSHLAGIEMKIQHVRNGTELEPLANSVYYDFEFQDALSLPETRKAYPGDDFITTCTYNTVGRTNVTVYGERTFDEMCFTWLLFWPIPDNTSPLCVTTELNETHSRNLFGSDVFETPQITEPYVPPPCEEKEYGSSEIAALDADDIDAWRASFDHASVLSNDGESYTLYWSSNQLERTVRMGVDVATSGWVGFGISPNGGMVNADIVMAWVDDETQEVYFSDRKAIAESLPIVDEQQDYFDVRGLQYEADVGLSGEGPSSTDDAQSPSASAATHTSSMAPPILLLAAAMASIASEYML